MEKHLIRLAGIAENSLVNGPGLRKVFFSQGCTHVCKHCFNPTTWSFTGGKLVNMDELIKQVEYESFLDGVTFSGGDPFQQPQSFAYLAEHLHQLGINIWIYTGYTFEELLQLSKTNPYINKMLYNCDVIVDGLFKEELMSDQIMYRGSSNQKIIDVPLSLQKNTIITIDYDHPKNFKK